MDRMEVVLSFYLGISLPSDECLPDIELWSCCLAQRLSIYHGLLERDALEELEALSGQGSLRGMSSASQTLCCAHRDFGHCSGCRVDCKGMLSLALYHRVGGRRPFRNYGSERPRWLEYVKFSALVAFWGFSRSLQTKAVDKAFGVSWLTMAKFLELSG